MGKSFSADSNSKKLGKSRVGIAFPGTVFPQICVKLQL